MRTVNWFVGLAALVVACGFIYAVTTFPFLPR